MNTKNCAIQAFLILAVVGPGNFAPFLGQIDGEIGASLSSQIANTSIGPDYILHSEPVKFKVMATAYSSTPDQTDSTPFTTASGKRVRDGFIAANFLKFGTKVQIPELYGDKVFVVEDRMHPRFNEYVDIWFPDRRSALKFGKKEVEIVVLL